MNLKMKKLLSYVGCLWIGILTYASACPLKMEAVLAEARASYGFAHVVDGEITYEKLKLLGIAEEAERILQEWVDTANREQASLKSDPRVFPGALSGVLRKACQGASEEIYKLYCHTSSATHHQKNIDEIKARIAAAAQKKTDS
jgi:hypothetical protein